MKIALAAMVTALTAAVVVVLMSTPREPRASAHFADGPVAASPASNLAPETAASPAVLEGSAPSQPQGARPSSRSELVSLDAPDAPAAPAPAVLPPPDGQVDALQQLVTQSRQENEQLGQIDDHLTALQQQAADQEARRQWEAEQEAAQHDATLEALATLRHADALLATGNWEGVDDELGLAEAVLSGRTRLDVEAAREALAQSNLLTAREYLAAALSERRPLH
jgi:hypothetical protein